jgi:hypothetical protein
MCCGNGDSAGSSQVAAVADTAQRLDPDQIYVVAYFNGVTEEVVGLDGARNLLINMDARVEGARTVDDFPLGVPATGGTYFPKR